MTISIERSTQCKLVMKAFDRLCNKALNIKLYFSRPNTLDVNEKEKGIYVTHRHTHKAYVKSLNFHFN